MLGQQLLVEDPGERGLFPPGPLRLLEEHQVVVGLAQAGVLLLMPAAEEQLRTSPENASWKSKAQGLVSGAMGERNPGGTRPRGKANGSNKQLIPPGASLFA